MSKTKIVCTIGPASRSPETIGALLEHGMTVARINLAHGRKEDHLKTIATILDVSQKKALPCAIMADLSGPEIRISHPNISVQLIQGEKIHLLKEEKPRSINVNHNLLLEMLEIGDSLIVGDGEIVFGVSDIVEGGAELNIIDGGMLKPNQRLTLMGKTPPLPPLTQKDIEDIQYLLKEDVDFFALSFVRQAADILLLKEKLLSGGSAAAIVAKIETGDAVKNFDEILDAADAIMVARGDLGIELPPEDIPILQKQIIRKTVESGKPVITATQMLESMVANSRPTRAEANDVANAIFDGTDAIMLSEETAIGEHPVEVVKVMSRIALKTEEAFDYEKSFVERSKWLRSSPTVAISFASCELSHNLDAKAIITATQSGNTARQVSKYRPKAPVIAVTPSKMTYQQLLLTWGVIPILIPPSKNIDDMFKLAVDVTRQRGFASEGDLLVITAGVQVNIPGSTNLIKIDLVGK